MPKKKEAKHPREMTTDELARHVFHPAVLKHAQRAVREIPKPINAHVFASVLTKMAARVAARRTGVPPTPSPTC